MISNNNTLVFYKDDNEKKGDDKISEVDKKNLSNFGSWVGKITLARNKPLLSKYIDPKKTLEELYPKRLDAFILFLCKVLESISDSTVFKIHNPWINSILESIS